jgi:hypothetical protein
MFARIRDIILLSAASFYLLSVFKPECFATAFDFIAKLIGGGK